MQKIKLGLIINPLAGIGGPLALKGSDGAEVVKTALALGANKKAGERATAALKELNPYKEAIEIHTYPGEMGEVVAKSLDFQTYVYGSIQEGKTTSTDTMIAVKELQSLGIDLLIFVGGDGTAKDVSKRISENQVAIGVPAGVKIHSAVYAITPAHAGQLIIKILEGDMVNIAQADVMDIDEQAFRNGIVKAKLFGHISVPQDSRFLQQVKCGGSNNEALELNEIANEVIDNMDSGRYYLIGSGTTPAEIMSCLGLENSLLGIDIIKDKQLIASDVTEQEILQITENKPAAIIVTIIGGQGHIFGRGNQQLSARVIKQVGKENIGIIASKSKLQSLSGRPLIVDSGDQELDEQMRGLVSVITGYGDYVLYALGQSGINTSTP